MVTITRAWPVAGLLLAVAAAWMAGPAKTWRNLAHRADPMHAGAQHAMGVPGNAASDRPATQLRLLSCEPLPDLPGTTLTTAIVEFPPRAYTPAHRHPGSVSVHVLRGQVRSQLEGGSPRTFNAGETWFEPPGILHRFAENPADEPAALLAVFITDAACGPLVIPEP